MDTMVTPRPEDDDAPPEVNQPGLGELRSAVANRPRFRLPGGAALRQDALAGLSSAVSNVPDGMANGVLVGVNPVYGLYATMFGPGVGGLFSSTQLMLVTTTAAASLSTSQALGNLTMEARADTLFLTVMLVGAFQVLFGLLRFGKLLRFVSYSVTTGFLTGVSVLLILGQLPVVAGYQGQGGNRITQTLDLLRHLERLDLITLGLAALTLLLALLLPQTQLGNFGRLAAIALPSALVALLGLNGVEVVRDVGEIPSGLPTPALPVLSRLSVEVVTGALAVAVVILVQGAGVSQSVPNPDGSRRRTSRDFIAQGTANLASGLFRGLPVGGSLSATALNVLSGAQSRWAVIFAGVWMLLIVTLLPGLVSAVAMPALGALLILAGASSLKPAELRSVWRTGWASRIAGGATFLAALFLSIQAAVGIGVALSALFYVNRSSTDITLVRLVRREDGRIVEREAPERLPSDGVTVLDVYGNLFYAGAQTLERLLPRPGDARRPVVVLRLRGLKHLGATLLETLSGYADQLETVGGRLYLSGLDEDVHARIVATGKLSLSGPVRAYGATDVRGESTDGAVADARTWLVDRGVGAVPREDGRKPPRLHPDGQEDRS